MKSLFLSQDLVQWYFSINLSVVNLWHFTYFHFFFFFSAIRIWWALASFWSHHIIGPQGIFSNVWCTNVYLMLWPLKYRKHVHSVFHPRNYFWMVVSGLPSPSLTVLLILLSTTPITYCYYSPFFVETNALFFRVYVNLLLPDLLQEESQPLTRTYHFIVIIYEWR